MHAHGSSKFCQDIITFSFRSHLWRLRLWESLCVASALSSYKLLFFFVMFFYTEKRNNHERPNDVSTNPKVLRVCRVQWMLLIENLFLIIILTCMREPTERTTRPPLNSTSCHTFHRCALNPSHSADRRSASLSSIQCFDLPASAEN